MRTDDGAEEVPAAALAACRHSTLTSPTHKSVRPQFSADGSHADAGHRVEAETMDECVEHAGANEDIMESESSSVEGSDEESAGPQKPDSDAQGVSGHDEKAAQPDEARGTLGEEEVSPPKVASQPHLPSRDEVDVHEAMGHAQYRCWCEACVHGQGREDLHLRVRNDVHCQS